METQPWTLGFQYDKITVNRKLMTEGVDSTNGSPIFTEGRLSPTDQSQ